MKRNALLILMESIWLLALLFLLDAAVPYPSPMLWALLLYPAAYGLARLIPIRDERLWVELAISGGLLAAILAIAGCAVFLMDGFAGAGSGVHPIARFVLASFLGAYVWMRGWWRARFDVDAKGFVVNFQFGLAMMVAALFGLSKLEAPIAVQAGLAIAFGAVGLVGLAMARPTDAAASDMPGRLANILAILSGLITVFALAGLFWLLVDRAALDSVVNAATEAGGRLSAFLAGLFPDAEPASVTASLPPQAPLPPHADDGGVKLSEGGSIIAPIIVIVATSLAIVVIYIRQLLELFRRLRTGRRTVGVTYGVTGDGFFIQLRNFLIRIVAATRRAGHRLAARLRRWLAPRPAEGLIRERYRQLLGRLAFRGRRRLLHETPSEYHRRLVPLWPGSDPDFAKFTDAFVAECYGRSLADPAEVEATWRRLRSVIGKIRGPNG